MTPRERMIATLSHVKPDRVPIQLGCRPEVMAAMRRHYKVEDDLALAKVLEADLYRYAFGKTRWREFERKADGQMVGGEAAIRKGTDGPGRAVIRHDEQTFEDEWGVVQRLGKDGKYLQWVGGPLVHTDDLDSFPWPSEADITMDPSMPAKVAEHKKAGYWVLGSGGTHPFKQAWHMRGFENFLCDYVANPDFVDALYDRLVNFAAAHCRLMANAGVDMIEYWGDVSMQTGMMVPPDAWRRHDKPAWRRIISETRKIKPDMRFFFHSDGDLTAIIDDIIEVGFDILNPIQPECVNPAEIKRRWGDRITLDGGGSVQRTLPFGTLDDVRREVDFLMRTCAYNGGYIFRTSNAVQFDAPTENVVLFYEMARDYDLSTLTGPPKEIPQPPCMNVNAGPA